MHDHLLAQYRADADGVTVTLDEGAQDNFVNRQSGTATTDNEVDDPFDPDGGADPGDTAAEDVLLAGDDAAEETTDGSFQDAVTGNEQATRHQVLVRQGSGWQVTVLTVDAATSNNFTTQASGTGTLTGHGTAGSDEEGGGYSDRDSGSDGTQYHLRQDGAGVTLRVDEAVSDSYQDSADGDDRFDKTLDSDDPLVEALGLQPFAGLTPAEEELVTGNASDHVTGDDRFNERVNGDERLDLHVTLRLEGGHWVTEQLSADLHDSNTFNASDGGTAEDSETGGSGTDEAGSDYQDSDQGNEQTDIHLAGTPGHLTATVDVSGNDQFSDSAGGDEEFDNTADPSSPLGEALGLAPLLGGTAAAPLLQSLGLSDHLTGSDDFDASVSGTELFRVHQTLQQDGDSWTAGATTADLTVTDSFDSSDTGTADDRETGSAGSDAISEDFQDSASGSEQLHLHIEGSGDSFTVTEDETETDQFSDRANGDDDFDHTADPTSALGAALGLTPLLGGSAATQALASLALHDHLSGNDSFNNAASGSERLTLHRVWQVAGDSWTLDTITADLHTEDTFDASDAGTAEDEETGSAGTDEVDANFQDSARGSEHTDVHVEGTGDNLTVTEDYAESDQFSDTEGGSDAFDNTVDPRSPLGTALDLTPLDDAGTTAAQALSDHLSGNETFSDSVSGTEQLTLHQVWQVAGDTWTRGATTLDLTVDDTFSDSDSGTASETETGNGGPDEVQEGHQDSDNGTDHVHVHVEGSGDNLTATVDETESDSASHTELDSADGDAVAEALDGSTDEAGDSSSGNEDADGAVSVYDTSHSDYTLTLHSTWELQNGTWVETTLSGELTSDTSDSSSEVDDVWAPASGGAASGTSEEHASHSQSAGMHQHLLFSGSPSNLTVTEDDSEDAAFTATDYGNATAAGGPQEGFSSNSGGSSHDTAHAVWSFDGTTWTLLSITQTHTGGDTYNAGSADGQPGGSGTAPSTSSDSQAGAHTATEQLTGNGSAVLRTQDLGLSVDYTAAETQGDAGTPTASQDSLAGTTQFALHRVLGGDPAAPTVQSATVDVDGTFVDAASGPASFHLHVTGGPGGYTTTVEQTGTDRFTDLTVTVEAGDTWLDGFAAQVAACIQSGLGANGSAPPGSTQATNHVSYGPDTPTVTQTANGAIHTRVTNSQDRLLQQRVTDQATGAVLYAYSATYDAAGHQLTAVDGQGRKTAWTYDSAGHATSETVAAGTARAATTTFVWQGDQLVQVLDPDQNVTTFAYDAQGRKVAMTDPLGHTETWTYTAQGQVASEANRNGLRRTFAYDEAGRETSETCYAADGVTVTDTLTFTYTEDGKLATASNSEGTYAFTYDAQGRLIHVDEPFGVSLDFAYDAQGNRTLVQDSFGGTTQSTYDAANQLVSRLFTAAGQPTLRIDLGYNADGQVVQQTRYGDAAGTQEVGASGYGYDAQGNVAWIRHTDGAGNIIGDYAYTYDAAGELTREVADGTATTFGYDAAGQLTADGTGTYSYDPNGNRTNAGYVTGRDNQLLSDGTFNYTYDAEGNELTKTAIATGDRWTYGYDNLNHLVSAVETAADSTVEVQATYKYDVFGNRLEKDVWTATVPTTAVTRYTYDGWNPARGTPVGTENFDVWAELDGSGSLITWYMHGDVVDQLFARLGDDGTAAWLDTDQLGSVRAVTDGNGLPVDQIAYDGFGNILTETNPAAGGVYKWTGREFDAETGLQYNRARYYDPSTGRWICRDPLGFAAGDPNLYRYLNNQPTEGRDPSGLQPPGYPTNGHSALEPWWTPGDDGRYRSRQRAELEARLLQGAGTIRRPYNAFSFLTDAERSRLRLPSAPQGSYYYIRPDGAIILHDGLGSNTVVFASGAVTFDRTYTPSERLQITQGMMTPRGLADMVLQPRDGDGGLNHPAPPLGLGSGGGQPGIPGMASGGGVPGGFRGPAARQWNWEHIFDRHSDSGGVAAQRGRSDQVFQGLTREQIRARAQAAWDNRGRVQTQVGPDNVTRIYYEGVDPVSGQRVGFWFNDATRTVESAFPVGG